ncbi:MAG: cation-translocating P-type ATPase [Fimbriimonadaceae bacterium]|nr:cation-translocating P-type ATPase [Fimbriimonadaceae bacterium]QYK55808.1 MAG: cation-translocating P-type ATPase [Fimbriimonadaceae bacterium]
MAAGCCDTGQRAPESSWARNIQVALTVVCGLALVVSFFEVTPVAAYVAVLAGSYFAVLAAWNAVRERRIDVNVLMLLAAAGSVALGHPVEAAVLLFLFSLSSTLEEFALSRTRSAIEGLIKLRPNQALLVESSGDTTVETAAVKVDQRVRVLPYDLFPLDGEVVQGETSVDQSAMTGESVPVPKTLGDHVFAGTQNQDGMVVVRVTRPSGDTTLDRIVTLVQETQQNKASGERVSQWFGQSYTFFVIGAASLSVVVRFLIGQPSGEALYASLTLLVALSPCALVISTPATTLSALAWAARKGLLIRGGEFIESSGTVKTVLFDKTGTLTVGRPVLSEICVCGKTPVAAGRDHHCAEGRACWNGHDPLSDEAADILRVAASAEQYSTHPLAEAIVAGARQQGLDVPEATDSRAVSGMGVTAVVEGNVVRVGQLRFFEDDGLPAEFLGHVAEIQRKGMTVAVMQHKDTWAALGLRDGPRPEAKAVVESLREFGVSRIAMVTGDNRETAMAVAQEVGIDEVHSGLLPEDKEKIVAEAVASPGSTLFVGDGINDAPSLARAHVGVAMGGLGSDVALSAADVVLMQDNLNRLPELLRLGRATNATIRANLIFAGGVIACLTLGSLLFDSIFPNHSNWVLPLAVVGHEGSTVLVILNGLRLLRGPR